MATMPDFIQQLPKAELHVHLEGSIEPGTLRELEPAVDEEILKQRYNFSDFDSFLKSFGWIAGHLREPADYAVVARRLLDRLEQQNVRYAEITLSAGVILWRKQDLAAVHAALREETRRGPVECWWIWDSVRQWDYSIAERVVEMAIERVNDGVIAFGLGGDEARGPAKQFAPLFAAARRSGLRLLCHAGEVTGPASIWEALEVGAERIGHGIACVEDPELMRHLADHDVPLEVCLTSNDRTGATARYGRHPLRRILDAGVPVTLHTDDPAMFRCSLEDEYRAAAALGVNEGELERIAANGFRYAFRGATPYRRG